MPLRDLVYYPPFFAVVALALFIGIVFLSLIFLERRRVKKMRRALAPGASPARTQAAKVPPRQVAPSEAATTPAHEAAVKIPVPARQPAPPVVPETPVAPILTGVPAAVSQAVESAALPATEAPPVAVMRESFALSHLESAPASVVQEPQPVPSPVREAPRAIAAVAAPPAPTPRVVPAVPVEEAAVPDFRTFERQSSLTADFLRSLIIGFAGLTVAALALLALPQSTFDRMADSLRYRNAKQTQQEMLAFLYLGDEVKGNEFHIRGVVRNITTKPIEELDASIRLYAPDRTLLETAVVRMDIDHIEPDATANFHLSYPDYHGQFGSYSVDFKLRRGDPVPFKDMRGVRARD